MSTDEAPISYENSRTRPPNRSMMLILKLDLSLDHAQCYF